MKKSLPEWFSYIERLHPQEIELGLARVSAVAERLGITTFSCPVITVGGTNGKGSCVAFLDTILEAAGYKVGAYTSPHLLHFNERICIAGQPVSDPVLLQAFERIEGGRSDIALTYFEFTTLAALLIFQAANLDVVILEVGLGGRLDAVNMVEPDISIITSIALDHMDWLGDTREAIGAEKAGIFRVGKPAICGDPDPPQTVLDKAKQLSAFLYCVGSEFNFAIDSESPQRWTWQHQTTIYSELQLPQLPLENAATALMAIQCLQTRLHVPLSAITHGLEHARLAGRFQYFSKPIQTIVDVAHNPAAAVYLAKRLTALPTTGITRAVVSILSDKDIEETLRPLLETVKVWYVAPLDLPRGSTINEMVNCLQKLGVAAYDIRRVESVIAAYEKAISEAKSQDCIVVFGSFYVAAPVLARLNLSFV